MVRRNPAELRHPRTSGGKARVRAGGHGRLVGCAGELGHVPSFRTTRRMTVMGVLWNLQMKSHYIKAKYYYCYFYSHSMCLKHSPVSAFIFNTNRKKKVHLRGWPAYGELSYMKLWLFE